MKHCFNFRCDRISRYSTQKAVKSSIQAVFLANFKQKLIFFEIFEKKSIFSVKEKQDISYIFFNCNVLHKKLGFLDFLPNFGYF